MVVKGDFLSFKFDGHDISEFGAITAIISF